MFAAATGMPAWGDLLLTSGITMGGVVVDRTDNITDTTDASLSRNQTFSFSYTNPVALTGSFDAQGVVTYGTLRASVSASEMGASAASPVVTVFSSALWADALTFDATSNGVAYLTFQLTGSSSSSNNSPLDGVRSSALVRFYGGVAGTPVFTDYLVTNSSLDATYLSAAVPFTAGVPVEVEGTVGTNLTFSCSAPVVTAACLGWTGEGDVDFAHTVVLDGIHLFDDSGNPIQDFTISSQSGTKYTSSGVVPEPDSLLLIATVLSLVLCIAYHRQPHPKASLVTRVSKVR
jgi:hypothetical protein